MSRKITVIEQKVARLERAAVNLTWRSVSDEGLYGAGWSDVSGYEPLAFAISRDGIVYFRGVTQSDGSGFVIFTIPEGFRPEYSAYVPICEEDLANPGLVTAAALRIDPLGWVVTGDGASGALVFCDGGRYVP